MLVEAVVSGAYNASISLENLSTTVSHTTGSNKSSGARKEEKLVNHMELMMKMDYWLGVGTNVSIITGDDDLTAVGMETYRRRPDQEAITSTVEPE
mmetsp:Transcript_65/g.94  ORF Transcript_65/g.94 Transcript_65/m.94 type:complete len:96 (+) Transcript_65:2098-2385(+)